MFIATIARNTSKFTSLEAYRNMLIFFQTERFVTQLPTLPGLFPGLPEQAFLYGVLQSRQKQGVLLRRASSLQWAGRGTGGQSFLPTAAVEWGKHRFVWACDAQCAVSVSRDFISILPHFLSHLLTPGVGVGQSCFNWGDRKHLPPM